MQKQNYRYSCTRCSKITEVERAVPPLAYPCDNCHKWTRLDTEFLHYGNPSSQPEMPQSKQEDPLASNETLFGKSKHESSPMPTIPDDSEREEPRTLSPIKIHWDEKPLHPESEEDEEIFKWVFGHILLIGVCSIIFREASIPILGIIGLIILGFFARLFIKARVNPISLMKSESGLSMLYINLGFAILYLLVPILWGING